MKMDVHSLCCHCTMLGTNMNTLQACPLVLQLYISCFVIFVRHLKCHEIKYLFMLWIDKDVLDVKLLGPIYLDSSFEVTIFCFVFYTILFQNVIFEMTSPFCLSSNKACLCVAHMTFAYLSILFEHFLIFYCEGYTVILWIYFMYACVCYQSKVFEQ